MVSGFKMSFPIVLFVNLINRFYRLVLIVAHSVVKQLETLTIQFKVNILNEWFTVFLDNISMRS